MFAKLDPLSTKAVPPLRGAAASVTRKEKRKPNTDTDFKYELGFSKHEGDLLRDQVGLDVRDNTHLGVHDGKNWSCR